MKNLHVGTLVCTLLSVASAQEGGTSWNPWMTMLALTSMSTVQAWHNDWDAGLHFECPQGQYISRIQSIHSNGREDRIWHFECKIGFVGRYCWNTGYVNNWDGWMDFSCNGNGIITGAYSHHDNGKEDRRWKFRCCQMDYPQARMHDCKVTNWINSWDNPMNYAVEAGRVIIGFQSKHDNGKEDRIWKVRKCTPTVACQGRNTDWNCCTRDNPCNKGEGDCDNDSECKPGLKCGYNNCIYSWSGSHHLADCCTSAYSGRQMSLLNETEPVNRARSPRNEGEPSQRSRSPRNEGEPVNRSRSPRNEGEPTKREMPASYEA